MQTQWVPDEVINACTTCNKEFSFFVRKHHCRACGMIFCDDCSDKRMPMPQSRVVREQSVWALLGQLDTLTNPMVAQATVVVRVCQSCWKTQHEPQTRGGPTASGYFSLTPQEPTTPDGPPPLHPAAEEFQGPPPPLNPGPVPPWPAKMLINLPTALQQTLYMLQNKHVPAGIAGGFVVNEIPYPGGLGQQYGLQLYDFIYAVEDKYFNSDTDSKELSQELVNAFNSKGTGTILVYNFKYQTYRKIHIQKPTGVLPSKGLLSVACAQLPISNRPTNLLEESPDVYTNAWIKNGPMFISTAPAPVYAALTPQNANIYVKLYRNINGMWISTGESHPLYDYTQVSEPLYVEAWYNSQGLAGRLGGQKFAKLPMQRTPVSHSAPQGYQQIYPPQPTFQPF